MHSNGNIHDAFFRDIMSRREVAADFLRQYLPHGVTRHLDLDTLAITKDTFVSGDQSRHYSDLLYQSVEKRRSAASAKKSRPLMYAQYTARPGFFHFLASHHF